MQQPNYLELPHGRRLAYAKTPGAAPGVMFLPGFKSDMTGAKALATAAWCAENARACLRFDYTGHGASSGEFTQGTIGAWLADALDVFDALTEGPTVLVGSSMGGWIALLLALARPERARGLIGIAPAPDFTEELIWKALDEEKRREMVSRGHISVPNCYGAEPYILTHRLIEEGRNHLLLHDRIPIHCPVRLLHGEKDEDVPWRVSATLLEKLESADATLTLIKNGNHRLSEEDHLKILRHALSGLR